MTESTLTTHTPESRKKLIILYTAAVFLYWLALYLYVPTLPTYVEGKVENLAMVGGILSMYGLWQAIIRLPLGIVSDWLGQRKPFIMGGLILAAIGTLVMAFSESGSSLLIGRAITGLAAGTWVPLVVVFSSLFPPEEAVRASSLLTLVGSIARILATGANGPINELSGGYSLAFFLAAGAALLAVIIVMLGKETRRPPKQPSLKSIGILISRRDVLLPSLLSLLAQYVNWTATFSFIPLLAKSLGASGITLSVLLSTNLVIYTLGNLMSTAIVGRLGAKRMIYLSFILLFIGLASAAMAPSLAIIFVAQGCIGLAQGVGYPVLMGLSIRHVNESQRTSAMGLHQAVYAIGMFAGPAISGIIADAIGIRPMFGITAGVFIVVGLLAARMLGESKTA